MRCKLGTVGKEIEGSTNDVFLNGHVRLPSTFSTLISID